MIDSASRDGNESPVRAAILRDRQPRDHPEQQLQQAHGVVRSDPSVTGDVARQMLGGAEGAEAQGGLQHVDGIEGTEAMTGLPRLLWHDLPVARRCGVEAIVPSRRR